MHKFEYFHFFAHHVKITKKYGGNLERITKNKFDVIFNPSMNKKAITYPL